jgi:hypothetical protein
LKSCKITILNPVSRVYKEYIIYCAVTARLHQKVKNVLFLKVSNYLPPFLKVPPVRAFQNPNFQIQNKVTNYLYNLLSFTFRVQPFLFFFFNYSLKSKSPLTCTPGSKSINMGGKELYLQIATYRWVICDLQLWGFFRC